MYLYVHVCHIWSCSAGPGHHWEGAWLLFLSELVEQVQSCSRIRPRGNFRVVQYAAAARVAYCESIVTRRYPFHV